MKRTEAVPLRRHIYFSCAPPTKFDRDFVRQNRVWARVYSKQTLSFSYFREHFFTEVEAYSGYAKSFTAYFSFLSKFFVIFLKIIFKNPYFRNLIQSYAPFPQVLCIFNFYGICVNFRKKNFAKSFVFCEKENVCFSPNGN
jgi:hypothetical protein